MWIYKFVIWFCLFSLKLDPLSLSCAAWRLGSLTGRMGRGPAPLLWRDVGPLPSVSPVRVSGAGGGGARLVHAQSHLPLPFSLRHVLSSSRTPRGAPASHHHPRSLPAPPRSWLPRAGASVPRTTPGLGSLLTVQQATVTSCSFTAQLPRYLKILEPTCPNDFPSDDT